MCDIFFPAQAGPTPPPPPRKDIINQTNCWYYCKHHRIPTTLVCVPSTSRNRNLYPTRDSELAHRATAVPSPKPKQFVNSKASRPALGHPQTLMQWYWGDLFPEITRPGRQADHSPPSSTEGLDGLVTARSSAPVHTGPGVHPASCAMGTVSFPGVKQLGRRVNRPTPSIAEVKERVEVYLYYPSGPSWLVLG